MGNVICDLRNDGFSRYGRNSLYRISDKVSTFLIVALHGLFRVRENPIDGGNHPDDLLLGDLHAATDTVSRIVVLIGEIGQVLFAKQQPGVLRTAYPFTT